jgi:hypothetical protein
MRKRRKSRATPEKAVTCKGRSPAPGQEELALTEFRGLFIEITDHLWFTQELEFTGVAFSALREVSRSAACTNFYVYTPIR